MNKLKKLSDHYDWVTEISSKTIVGLKKTSDMLEVTHNIFFKQYGISNTKFNVLIILYEEQKNGIMLSEIGEQMLVTKANITGLIDRLEKDGFVKRTRDEKDRRKIMAVITKKGIEFTEKVKVEYKKWVENLMSELKEEEKNQLIATLSKLQNALIKSYEFHE